MDEAASLFPEARRLVMASDTLPGPAAASAAAEAIEKREVDLIIGTKIVAKGWHFPYLTLVGVRPSAQKVVEDRKAEMTRAKT